MNDDESQKRELKFPNVLSFPLHCIQFTFFHRCEGNDERYIVRQRWNWITNGLEIIKVTRRRSFGK